LLPDDEAESPLVGLGLPPLVGIRGFRHPQAVHPPAGDCVDSQFILAHRNGPRHS
jgi:hypothetical protein